ncbi:MAG: hypothetical protein ACRCZO_02260 [Cetobacterium sp.]
MFKNNLKCLGIGKMPKFCFLKFYFTGDENNAEEFKNYILTTYQKLVNCGGFEILKTSGMNINSQ